ncbi:GNAT family N-acetyltransferase [Clostridium chromiireducens]|uniref:N-acetyltransferase domain-containing protein n=1 Tax=Clostridium chromiireducens TaxID=225345 RepID=A0A1V4IH36_9CLOT|nr:GNAT family N-acetyltransferase [Clostridium chromiireducens]OPJ59160.1 hypothetical protein CLCHR_36320 [Clostridium chromiireducens]
MYLKQLSDEEIKNIHEEHMKIDFPPEELKPIEVIQKLIKRGIYVCYGLYEDNKLLAYAFLVTSKSYLLIDYYSVCAIYRNRGIGSKFLNLLKEQCRNYIGIIVEVESINSSPNVEERVTRERRINFYKNNGMRMTNILSLLFNVEYSIMCLCNEEVTDSNINDGLEHLYKEITPSKLYNEYVKITLLQ